MQTTRLSATHIIKLKNTLKWNDLSIAFTLTHLGRLTHICVSKLIIIGSDNGLSPDRRQAIIWTNAGLFLIGPLGTNFSEILIEILTFSFKKMHLKVSSAKWRPFCLGLNVLRSHFVARHVKACRRRINLQYCPYQDKISWSAFLLLIIHLDAYNYILGSLWNAELKLTHWGRGKMAVIFQTTFSNAFSWMKINKLRLRFHWILFPRVKLTIFHHWFR